MSKFLENLKARANNTILSQTEEDLRDTLASNNIPLFDDYVANKDNNFNYYITQQLVYNNVEKETFVNILRQYLDVLPEKVLKFFDNEVATKQMNNFLKFDENPKKDEFGAYNYAVDYLLACEIIETVDNTLLDDGKNKYNEMVEQKKQIALHREEVRKVALLQLEKIKMLKGK